MKSIGVVKDINASPSKVWGILTNARGWKDWNTLIERVEGNMALDETLTIYTKASDGRGSHVKITDFVPNERMVWSGGLPFKILKTIRTFTLEKKGSRATVFRMEEEFKGIFAGYLADSVPGLQPVFEEFADDLKKRAENNISI